MKTLNSLLSSCALVLLLTACGKQETPAPPPTGTPPPTGGAGHHGPGIELGTATIGTWTVRAARDVGAVTAGGEVPADAWVSGGPVDAVRFWIGAEGATDVLKVLAPVEDPAHPDHFHTHVEVPDPMADNARLFVEIEHKGQRSTGSFDLKR